MGGESLAQGLKNFGGVAGYMIGNQMLKSGDKKERAAEEQQKAMLDAMKPATATTVGADDTTTANANRGRAALISTSSAGVLGTSPTGRAKVLGN